jgi:Family of unknown function (DUF6507)
VSRYDIDPIGVQSVLSKVEPHLHDLQTAAKGVQTGLNDAAVAASSKVVAGALSDFAQARAPELISAGQAAADAVSGTAQAVLAYVEGDLKMMHNAQQQAAPVVVSRPGARRVGFS